MSSRTSVPSCSAHNAQLNSCAWHAWRAGPGQALAHGAMCAWVLDGREISGELAAGGWSRSAKVDLAAVNGLVNTGGRCDAWACDADKRGRSRVVGKQGRCSGTTSGGSIRVCQAHLPFPPALGHSIAKHPACVRNVCSEIRSYRQTAQSAQGSE